jgi:dTMP kinase
MPKRKEKKQLKVPIAELLEKHEKKRGLLIAFEGLDGAGKTTQRKLFRQWLKSAGYVTVTTKWNSSSLIKPLLQVRKSARSLTPEEFCLLHAADMRHRLETIILPALWQGKTVIADRWFFTALARDGARGLPLNWLLNVYSPMFWPDIVFYFSVSLETSRKRLFATRRPKFYQTGQDVTQLEDPYDSYRQFVGRVLHEYEALKMIFQFMQVDAESTIYEQHQHVRLLFRQCRRRPWTEWNTEVLEEWLARNPQLLEATGGRR